MAAVCGGETESSTPVEPSSEGARRRRMEIHQFRFVSADVAVAPPLENERKRQRIFPASPPRERESEVESCDGSENCKKRRKLERNDASRVSIRCEDEGFVEKITEGENTSEDPTEDPTRTEHATCSGTEPDCPKFGTTSICGRRRDMEDAVAIHPSFFRQSHENSKSSHFFGVYDGHGCSHVAMKCRDRMHKIVQSEIGGEEPAWKDVMTRSFYKMDQEITDWSSGANAAARSSCRCELQTPQCDAVGSTAVVAVVTPENIVVSNCGDSRAVLCRNGAAIPLSVDHKPDRLDEVTRIEAAGGRVIYWDGPRVLGVLAMSRAIGDNYLKPYVISEPEVTVTERTAEDECLILASDGLWDVVSNETVCGVARMCLRQGKPPSPPRSPGSDDGVAAAGEGSDKACSDASILLTKLALARYSTDNISVVVVDLRRNP